MSEYRFMVKEINLPENPLPVQSVSVSTLTATWENILRAHLGEVEGKISEVFVTPANFTIFKLKNVDGLSNDMIECALPPEIFDREGVCPPGKAVITAGGNLPARYVIHAVGPIWSGGNRSEPELLADCYRSSLQ